MIDPIGTEIHKHMKDAVDKREADLNKEAADTRLMGEKEFFDVMKSINQYLSMEDRWLLASIGKAFKKARHPNDSNR